MTQYLIRRLLVFIPTFMAITLITYTLGFYGPGDPVRIRLGENWHDEEAYIALKHELGLDRPFAEQFFDYLLAVVQGDFGISIYRSDLPVGKAMAQTLPVSATLALASCLIIIFVGVPLGLIAALNHNTWIDYLLVSVTVLGSSIPVFVLAPIFMIVLVLKLNLINTIYGWEGFFSQKIIMPALILAFGPLLGVMRLTRQGVLEVLNQDYVRTARAKGLPRRTVVGRHVLRNAITPLLTNMGLVVAFLITGSILLEGIFGIPGFGGLIVKSLRQRDYPILMGTTIVGAAIIMLANLIVDTAYAYIDPRVKYD
ncbi:MAG: ABC transporter permease [Caldilineaceae bacterium]|uniref:ABC transporter permease n=1 Tax=Caldilineaceae bacterium SB0675_bin_29 TaxID=2605266 RepID=A0A6B1G2A2_9CHLR|nr:ABC transporter permease [Caldilineaceae bacterium]MDE0464901.1 ABC transporter permease [Caldilineaceae bacterium]MXX25161.1 ABC transporter permease [Caldilineaceae bacterium SB0668_bin_21]MYC21174.1 ABC transporter permease [Caldilineaceae bacterium SB0662_bin_25]MYH62590.1 ABC transporter permease [Caldilineaceae bacterium SB0675_bin_29]